MAKTVLITAAAPVFRVASVARSAEWYADVLGFEEVEDPGGHVLVLGQCGP
jgi:catechol 2,3-dioxygenase-like lactoylglutathione lyase family enzyme